MFENKFVSAVIVAAGKGTRMGSEIPKQYMTISGKTIIDTTLYKFEKSNIVDEIILVVNKEDIDFVKTKIALNYKKITHVLKGGSSRTKSVYEGIKGAGEKCDIMLIHDGVRPFVSYNLISTCVENASKFKACIPVIDVVDTIKEVEDGFSVKTLDRKTLKAVQTPQALSVVKTLDRKTLKAVQTPQAFDYNLIRSCYDMAVTENDIFTDDASIVEYYGHKVKTIEGLVRNIKITTPMDLKIAEIFASIY